MGIRGVTPTVDEPTAAILVIGDEVLGARVTDVNSTFLCRRLSELGVAVKRVVVVPDEVPVIAAEVAACAAGFTHVITTGGVGPTHDDVTMESVAKGFGMALRRHPEAEAAIRAFYGADMNEAALRMAELPEGARLIMTPAMRFPVIRVENLWVFPGSPHLLKKKFEMVAGHFASTPFITETLCVNTGEPDIAPFLGEVQTRFPGAAIGSYPQEPGTPFRLMITVKGKNGEVVAATAAALREGLAEWTVEPPTGWSPDG